MWTAWRKIPKSSSVQVFSFNRDLQNLQWMGIIGYLYRNGVSFHADYPLWWLSHFLKKILVFSSRCPRSSLQNLFDLTVTVCTIGSYRDERSELSPIHFGLFHKRGSQHLEDLVVNCWLYQNLHASSKKSFISNLCLKLRKKNQSLSGTLLVVAFNCVIFKWTRQTIVRGPSARTSAIQGRPKRLFSINFELHDVARDNNAGSRKIELFSSAVYIYAVYVRLVIHLSSLNISYPVMLFCMLCRFMQEIVTHDSHAETTVTNEIRYTVAWRLWLMIAWCYRRLIERCQHGTMVSGLDRTSHV